MNEKLMILKMLQDGKITADEASGLLSSVENKKESPNDSTSYHKSAADHGAANAEPISNDGGHPSSSSPSFGVEFDNLSRKFASFAKDLEPKLQKVTETLAEKTVYFADKLSKSLDSSALPRTKKGTSPSDHTDEGIEKHIELLVEDGLNELSLSGLNGNVHIKGFNGDKISARIRYKANRRGNTPIKLIKLGGKYHLNYEEDDFQFVSIDAYVPSDKFNVINISGINGNMELSTLNCQELKVSNSNGQTLLSNLQADSIKSESGNGHLTISHIVATTGVFEHFNGAVNSEEIDVKKLSVTNFNGSLSVNIYNFKHFDEYLWNVETGNAKLTLNLPTLPSLGYHIRAHATLGDIRLGLTRMDFLINDPNLVEARSISFDKNDKKVRLSVETSNATLTVN